MCLDGNLTSEMNEYTNALFWVIPDESQLNQRSLILVTFRPTLLDQAIREEAMHLLQQDMSLCEKEMDKKKLELKVSIITC